MTEWIFDQLYLFAEWLRSTWLNEFAFWLSETSLAQWIVTNFWAIPTIQTFHITALAALFGSVLMINLKVLGVLGGHRTYAQTSARFIPWIRWGFVVLLLSGILLIVGEPVRELPNPIFWLKMMAIAVTVPISLMFNSKIVKLDAAGAVKGVHKLLAVLLILLWCLIMLGGRWIAYAPV
jgi:hypothetical protein